MENILKDMVVYGAPWCNSCKTVKQLMESQGVEHTYIDVDSPVGQSLMAENPVRSLPTVLYQGEVVATTVNGTRSWLKAHGGNYAVLDAIKPPAPKPPEAPKLDLEALENMRNFFQDVQMVNPFQGNDVAQREEVRMPRNRLNEVRQRFQVNPVADEPALVGQRADLFLEDDLRAAENPLDWLDDVPPQAPEDLL